MGNFTEISKWLCHVPVSVRQFWNSSCSRYGTLVKYNVLITQKDALYLQELRYEYNHTTGASPAFYACYKYIKKELGIGLCGYAMLTFFFTYFPPNTCIIGDFQSNLLYRLVERRTYMTEMSYILITLAKGQNIL